jgi:hypothetical protein
VTAGGLDDEQRAEAAAQLRAVLAAIDAGEVEATDMQRAYIAGTLHGLEDSVQKLTV